MKKLLCVVPALLVFAMIGAPNANADSYTPTFACENVPNHACFGPPTTPAVSFPGPTLTFNYLTIPTFTINLSASDSATDNYWWLYGSNQYPIQGVWVGGFSIIDLSTNITNSAGFSSESPLPFSDDISQGPLTFTPPTSGTPEPTPVLLMLFGVGLILFTRKRLWTCVQRSAQDL